MTSPLIGIESVMGESALALTKGYSGAVDQAAGYEATYLADESPANEWRTTDTDRDSSRVLVRWGRKRYLRTVAGWEHNLGRHALWRWTADDDYAIRPALLTDGIDDYAVATGITPSANISIFGRIRALAQPVANETVSLVLLHMGDAGVGIRVRFFWRAGNLSSPWQLNIQVDNYGVFSGAITSIIPDGKMHDLVFRYRNSDKRWEFWWDGVMVSSGTSTTPWVSAGNERLFIGALQTPGSYARAEWQDLRLMLAYVSDADIAAYRARIQSGTEKSLGASWHFLEGTGSSVASSTGSSNLAITGGAWVTRVNRAPRWSSGVQGAWGQWRRRQALRLRPGVYVRSPVLGNAARSITISFLLRIATDDNLVNNGAVVWYGPSRTDAEVIVQLSGTAGNILVSTFRGGPISTSSAFVADGVLRRVRAVLDGHARTISLYLAKDGETTETLISAVGGVAAYGTLANCRLEIGDSTALAEATCYVSDVRIYSGVRLEVDDSLTQDVAPTDPEMVAQLRLSGGVNDVVDPSRVYTESSAPAPTYDEISQTATRVLPAADERRVNSGDDPYSREQALLVTLAPAAVEAVEGYLEIWDPDNSDGYVRLAVLLPQDAFQPLLGRGWGLDRRASRRPVRRTVDGLVYRERGYDTDALVLRLPSVRTDGDADDVADTDASEADELLARLRRNPRERLVTVIGSPWVAQHRLAAHTVVGVATEEQAITDPAYGVSSTEITVESVRRPPSS